MTDEAKASHQRLWTIITLIVGAFLGFMLNEISTTIDSAREGKSIRTILKADIQNHLDTIGPIAEGLSNLKSGIPNLSVTARTVDRAIAGGPTAGVGMGIPEHNLTVFEQTVGLLHHLPPETLKAVLDFYDGIRNAESQRASCASVLSERASGERTDLMPVCDVYLDVLNGAASLGTQALSSLEK